MADDDIDQDRDDQDDDQDDEQTADGRKRKPGVRLPRVYRPAGRAHWFVRMRWEGRDVTRRAGATKAQARERALLAHALRLKGATLDEVLRDVFGERSGTGPRFDELAALYLESMGRSRDKKASTLAGDMHRLRGLCRAAWARKPAGAVRRTEVARWLEARRRVVAPSTSNRDLSMASTVFDWGLTQGLVDNNPCKGIGRKSEKGRAGEVYLVPAEVHGMLAAAPADLRPLLLCAVSTGMRRGELLALVWEDVDFTDASIRVRAETAKDSEERRVPMTADLAAELSVLKAERKVFSIRGGGPVFVSAEGRALSKTMLEKRWRATLATWTDRPERVRFHDLRHSAASLMVNRGVDLYTVGKILGHSNPETTARYSHVADKTKRRAIGRLGAALAPESSGLGRTPGRTSS